MNRPRRSRRQLPQWDDLRLPPRQYATLLLLLGIAGYGAFAIGGTVLRTTGAQTALLVTAVVLVVGLQVGFISDPNRGPRFPAAHLALALQAVLVIGPLLLFGSVWQGFSGFVSASALIVLPRPLGLLAFAGVVAAVVPATLAGPLADVYGVPYAVVYAVASTTTGTVAVYGLSTLARLVVQAHDTRSELQRVAVARERVRIARDVHDLLGESLSAIVLRCELVVRLLGDFPARARAELAAIAEVARRAGDDVRRVARVRDLTAVTSQAPPLQAPPPAPRLARSLLAVVVLVFFATAVVRAAVEVGPLGALLGAVLGLVFVMLVTGFVTRPDAALDGRRRAVILAVLAAVAFLPQPFLGQLWLGLPAYFAGVVLAVVPGVTGRLGWLAALALAVTAEVLDPGPGNRVYNLFYLGAGSVVISLVVFGLATLPRLVGEVNAARADLSRLAVAQERLRVARDVHDLLGLSLTTIVLKSELVAKLVDAAPERARAELDDVRRAARRAVDDMRTVLAGDGRMSLEEEFRLADQTLRAALIQVRFEGVGLLPEQPVATVLAAVLREGVTNVLRHSSAAWCVISLRCSTGIVVLEIANDGVGGSPSEDVRADAEEAVGGSGLVNMRERVRGIGGELTAGRDGPVHRLRASVPIGALPGRRVALVTAMSGSRCTLPGERSLA